MQVTLQGKCYKVWSALRSAVQELLKKASLPSSTKTEHALLIKEVAQQGPVTETITYNPTALHDAQQDIWGANVVLQLSNRINTEQYSKLCFCL
jgi:hypothetical protein